jgi:hypothetical protein
MQFHYICTFILIGTYFSHSLLCELNSEFYMGCSNEPHSHVWQSHVGAMVSAAVKKYVLLGGSNARSLKVMST